MVNEAGEERDSCQGCSVVPVEGVAVRLWSLLVRRTQGRTI